MIAEYIMIYLRDDWVSFDELWTRAVIDCKLPEEVGATYLVGFLAEKLWAGEIRVGQLSQDAPDGFKPWEGGRDEILERVIQIWSRYPWPDEEFSAYWVDLIEGEAT